MTEGTGLGLDTQLDASPSDADRVIDEQMQQCWGEHSLDMILAESGVIFEPSTPKQLPRRLDGSTHRYEPYPTPRPKDQVPERLQPSSTIKMSEADLIIWAAGAIRHSA